VSRPSKSRTLHAWMNGEYVGAWINPAGRPQEFVYAREWLASRSARPLSLSMPLTERAGYKGPVVERYFENLLPDSGQIRRRIGQHVGAHSDTAFDLLEKIGRDCVGALQLTVEREPAPNVRTINASPISIDEIGQLLLKTSGSRTFGAPELDDDFRLSIAGAQEKTALLFQNGHWFRPHGATPSTHILKLPLGLLPGGIDLRTSIENEWLCAQILSAYGVPTAKCSVAKFAGQKALVVERFDRRLSGDGSWIIRLPQEDFCQALGVAPTQKYQADGGPGIEPIMNTLLGSEVAEEDRKDFFRTQILFWMLCAIDGHAKNFSLFLNAGGSYRLTPRYDVLSAHNTLGTKAGALSPHKVKMAMVVRGSKAPHYHWSDILPRHFEQTAQRCGLGSNIDHMMEELIERTGPAIQAVQRLLPADFPQELAQDVLTGLRSAADRMKIKSA
jgi:serine/threonine-protein kinase HipA